MPPRRTPLAGSAPPPTYLTSLLGREQDMGEVGRLLRGHRLVSLVGAGGSGKTRLAAAVTTAQQRRPGEDVAWIDLAPLSDPALVSSHVAAALGVREQPGRSADDGMAELIADGAALLVLDNCEHVVGACAALAASLLSRCPALRILATSRQALGIPGEKAWLVPPLAVPAADDAAGDFPAIQLFVARAGDVVRGFSLSDANRTAIAHICRRLDGLPLAIELAAARVAMLPPAQLAERLDSVLGLTSRSEQRLPRHRTLRALIGWSYDLLSAPEQRLLTRLAVFSGSFTLDAAECVASDDALAIDDVLDLLASLVDKSLVTARDFDGIARFSLLETVRQYAAQAATDAAEDGALRTRHATYYVDLVETAEPHILGGGTRSNPWSMRLEHEHGNLRAAMEWCSADADRAALALRLGAALLWFHFALGHFEESRRAVHAALDRARDVPARVRARALSALGYMALWTGDAQGVMPPLTDAVDMLRGTTARTDLAFALTGLGTAAGLGGDAAGAYALFDEAETALGDPRTFAPGDYPSALLYAFSRYWRGTVAMAAGDLELARASYQAAVDVARSWGSHPTIAHPLAALARVLVLQGELDAAHACLAESLPIHAANDDRWGLIQALDAASLLLARRGAAQEASRVCGATDHLRLRTGVRPTPPEAMQREQLRALLHEALGEAGFDAAYAEGADMALPDLIRAIVGADVAPGGAEPETTTDAFRDADPGVVSDLEVRSLGRLEILVHGHPLDGDAFGSSRPRELLLLLLWHRDGRTREQIGLEFWPDASTAQVKNSFHVTLHRLRKALPSAEWIVIEGDRYRLNPSLAAVFDATLFRDRMQALLRERGGSVRQERDLLATLELYRGDFLDGELVGDWHLPVRDELQRLYRDGLRTLAGLRTDQGRFADAAEPLRALLASDPLDEASCRALMSCYAGTGMRLEAVRLYDSLVALLEDQLGTRPSRETTELYRTLQQTSAR